MENKLKTLQETKNISENFKNRHQKRVIFRGKHRQETFKKAKKIILF